MDTAVLLTLFRVVISTATLVMFGILGFKFLGLKKKILETLGGQAGGQQPVPDPATVCLMCQLEKDEPAGQEA